MINLSPLKGSSYIVLGLARSGLSTVRALVAAGIECAAWDDSAETRKTAADAGIRIAEPDKIDWPKITALVMSPGIPSRLPAPHPLAAAARAAGKPLICDIELLALAEPKARFVAVTGTNGKSTTTALIAHVLASAGWPSQVGGNIGRPALDLEPLGLGGVYVLEMSSYQLELVHSFHANVAVWLNITPDHLDRHGDMEGYVATKQHVFDNQVTRDCAIIGIDDKYSLEIFRWLSKRRLAEDIAVVPLVLKRVIAGGVNFEAGKLVDGEGYKVEFADVPTLPGDHNGQNAAAAWAAVRWIGVPREKAAAGLRSYPGLPHRQEQVAAVGNTIYVNDSKATNADATAHALSSYQDIYWILGGQAKEGGVTALAPYFKRVRHAFLIGESAELFAGQLEGKVAYTQCGDLQSAVTAAHAKADADAKEAAVVLLSPACASWDQWKSYEHRGDAFREMARALPGAKVLGRGA